jgi:hypothetical protein
VIFFSNNVSKLCIFIRSRPSPYCTVCIAILYAYSSATHNRVSLLLLRQPLKNKKYIQLRNIYKCKKVIIQTGWLVDREMFWQGDQRIKKWRPYHKPASLRMNCYNDDWRKTDIDLPATHMACGHTTCT